MSPWHPTAEFLPGKSHGQRSLVDYSPGACEELDMTERLNNNASPHIGDYWQLISDYFFLNMKLAAQLITALKKKKKKNLIITFSPQMFITILLLLITSLDLLLTLQNCNLFLCFFDNRLSSSSLLSSSKLLLNQTSFPGEVLLPVWKGNVQHNVFPPSLCAFT